MLYISIPLIVILVLLVVISVLCYKLNRRNRSQYDSNIISARHISSFVEYDEIIPSNRPISMDGIRTENRAYEQLNVNRDLHVHEYASAVHNDDIVGNNEDVLHTHAQTNQDGL